MKRSTLRRGLLVVLLVVVLGIVGYFFLQKTSVQRTAEHIFAELPAWLPDAAWGATTPAKQQTIYGEITGIERTATLTTENAYLPHFEKQDVLAQRGFQPDMQLSADGPGSSVWGYTKRMYGKKLFLLFSYQTTPTSMNPDEPLQFDCPCKTTVTVFLGN